MEVQGRQPNEPNAAQRRYLESRRDVFLANRERLRSGREERVSEALDAGEARNAEAREAAREELRPGDRLEVANLETQDPVRDERVEELRRLYQAGELHTPERAEKAAEGLLGQDA